MLMKNPIIQLFFLGKEKVNVNQWQTNEVSSDFLQPKIFS